MTGIAKTSVRFRDGIDPVTEVPEVARANGLSSRTAVIQDTYRADKVDMYFDEALWRRVLDYARGFREEGTIDIVDVRSDYKNRGLLARLTGKVRWTEYSEPVDDFLARWESAVPDEREPPLRIVVMDRQTPVLCVNTEFWAYVGGPPEYHDSYTYSVFSKDDRSASIRQFILAATAADEWDLTDIPVRCL